MQITIREPGSAITHFIALMMALFASVPLLVKAGLSSGKQDFTAMLIFMLSMVLLYGASTTYHSVNLSGRPLRIFRKLDHMMIFVLIAGSYTPVCLIVLGGKQHRSGGNADQGLLDPLSEMVLLRPVYRHGLGVSVRVRTAP